MQGYIDLGQESVVEEYKMFFSSSTGSQSVGLTGTTTLQIL